MLLQIPPPGLCKWPNDKVADNDYYARGQEGDHEVDFMHLSLANVNVIDLAVKAIVAINDFSRVADDAYARKSLKDKMKFTLVRNLHKF